MKAPRVTLGRLVAVPEDSIGDTIASKLEHMYLRILVCRGRFSVYMFAESF